MYTLYVQGTVDFAEFIALELMRMGKVEPSTLGLIKAEFERLDADGDGKLTISEVLVAGRAESADDQVYDLRRHDPLAPPVTAADAAAETTTTARGRSRTA